MKNQTFVPTFSSNFILGSERFEKFSAVEGIFLISQEKDFFAELDLFQLTNNERRTLVLARINEAV
jgi:hypothetical protein